MKMRKNSKFCLSVGTCIHVSAFVQPVYTVCSFIMHYCKLHNSSETVLVWSALRKHEYRKFGEKTEVKLYSCRSDSIWFNLPANKLSPSYFNTIFCFTALLTSYFRSGEGGTKAAPKKNDLKAERNHHSAISIILRIYWKNTL